MSNNNYSKNIININPEIYTINNFLTNEECDHIINISKNDLKNALVSSDKSGIISNGRTGQNTWLPHNYTNITKNISEKISNLLNISLDNAESIQVIYYNKTQEYKSHYDGWEFNGSERSVRNLLRGGQRIYTALCYLNDVEKGGGTIFTKINKTIDPEKGKLLVFKNVYDNSNVRHYLSEHAGMPVLEGEKWGFNLWFREKNTNEKYEYSLYHKNLSNKYNKYNISNTFEILNTSEPTNLETKKINYIPNILNNNDVHNILNLCNFDEQKSRSICWLNNEHLSDIINKISKLININPNYFESICVTKYTNNKFHNDHYDAYDLNTEIGQKNTSTRGQRLMTITGLLYNTKIKFRKLNKIYVCNKNSILYYYNCTNNTNTRDDKLIKSYEGLEDNMILFNIYIREKSKKDNKLLKLNNIKEEENKEEEEDEELDYNDIINNIYKKENNLNNLYIKNFNIIHRGCKDLLNNTLKEIKNTKNNSSFLIKDNIEKTYKLDEYNPVIVENVINNKIHKIIENYFNININNNLYKFGGTQSDRYYITDEIITRLLHIELLPLIEKITNKKMKATYSFLSAYVKNANLPPHTDRDTCQFTCSYILSKPENSNWNIYFDKTKKPIKNKGRYDYKPNKEDCFELDCSANGLMIFNGEDHIHYRENLIYDYYNIILLHYKSL